MTLKVTAAAAVEEDGYSQAGTAVPGNGLGKDVRQVGRSMIPQHTKTKDETKRSV